MVSETWGRGGEGRGGEGREGRGGDSLVNSSIDLYLLTLSYTCISTYTMSGYGSLTLSRVCTYMRGIILGQANTCSRLSTCTIEGLADAQRCTEQGAGPPTFEAGDEAVVLPGVL